MSQHYYSKSPQTKSAPKTWQDTIKGKQYTFTSDFGVFSKSNVDFGSKLLIEHFEEPMIEGDLLDLGCGYGPIGISLAKQYTNRHVVMIDINERAVALAKQNANHNQTTNTEIIQSDQFENIKNRSFAAIITNPPIRTGKKVIYGMFEKSKHSLLPGGALWIVIQKKQGAPSAKRKLEELFHTVEVKARSKGYLILKATNV